jgi:hypothetical protein
MKILDGCEIKVGTACSGTDIAVSVTKATFAALSEYFGVPYLKHVLFATYTIYIGFVCICQQSWQASFACNIHGIYIYILYLKYAPNSTDRILLLLLLGICNAATAWAHRSED